MTKYYDRDERRGRPLSQPPYVIDFEGHETVTTNELLEILDISYNTLYARTRDLGFPKPVIQGRNGKKAMYEVAEVAKWLSMRGVFFKL